MKLKGIDQRKVTLPEGTIFYPLNSVIPPLVRFYPFLTKRSICGILSMKYIKYVVYGDALVLSHVKYIYKKHLTIWILAKMPKIGIFAFKIREQI